MYIINRLLIKYFAEEIGQDQFGNQYFMGPKLDHLGRKRRYVIYNGKDESSKIPPLWHSWLHYTSNDIPTNIIKHNYHWLKNYLPNLTGTKYAYNPANSRNKIKQNYTPWQPKLK